MKFTTGMTLSCACAALFAGCAAGTGTGGGDYAARSDVATIEKRVEALEKASAASFEERLAALEKKVNALPAGGGVPVSGPPAGAGGTTADGLPLIGTPGSQGGTWKCPKLPAAPVIDGKLDDAAWKSAVQMRLVSAKETEVENATAILTGHDAERFYLAAVCMESAMDKLKITCTKRDEQVWKDDCVEIYIDQQQDKKDAVKIVVNPDGIFMDFIRMVGGDGPDVTLGMEVKTSKLQDRWIVELAIPFKDLPLEYKPGTVIRFNTMRMRPSKEEGQRGERSTWRGDSNQIAELRRMDLE